MTTGTIATEEKANLAKVETILPKSFDGGIHIRSDLKVERLYRKQRLAAAYRLFGRHGFDLGGAGHITARDPEYRDHFWVNPHGQHFSRIRVSDLMLVNHNGDIVEPPASFPARLNKAAFAIHSELHEARPDVIAAAHSHSLYGKAWSALGRLLDPISQDAAPFFEDHGIHRDYSGVVLDSSEGKLIAVALGEGKAVILQNHGILTVGQSVEAAYYRYILMENACQAQLLAEAAGKVLPMSAKVARHTRGQIATESGCIYSFQPYWDLITDQEPDLLS